MLAIRYAAPSWRPLGGGCRSLECCDSLRESMSERCESGQRGCRCSTLGQRTEVLGVGGWPEMSSGGCRSRDGRALELRSSQLHQRAWLGLGRETRITCCRGQPSWPRGRAGLGCCPSRAVGPLLDKSLSLQTFAVCQMLFFFLKKRSTRTRTTRRLIVVYSTSLRS